MFKKQRLILEENKKVLESIKKEREELLEIKRMLEDNSKKINITNVFIFKRQGHYDIVELRSEKIQGKSYRSGNKIVNGFHSQLINIFTNVIEYDKSNESPIHREEYVFDRYGDGYKAFLTPITIIDKNLLKYVDNMVPLVVLQRLYYKLNNVELTSDVKMLKKDK